MSLYHQRRFAKLGYSAASILSALPLLQMLLDETEKNNLLVQSCRMYLQCEFFLTELHALAYFTHKVTLPLLNCVEISDQNELLKVFPKLYEGLNAKKLDTLQHFLVSYKHLVIEEPTNTLTSKLLEKMCLDAAEGIKLQCGREYGFSESDARATELHKLSVEQLQGLPTNNLDAERDLSRFSRLAQVANYRNNKFTAKGIKDDMTLFKSNKGEIENISRKVTKILKSREKKWNESQKTFLQQRIQLKLDKRTKQTDYSKKLLEN